jgi:hypothetical protein
MQGNLSEASDDSSLNTFVTGTRAAFHVNVGQQNLLSRPIDCKLSFLETAILIRMIV